MQLIYIMKILIAFLLLCNVAVKGEEQRQKHIFVLGGNGFMGAEVVLQLLNDGYKVTTTNRGNWYWDNPVRVSRHVHHHFPCDRDDTLLKCWDLRDYIRGIDFFDAVIDFSCYKGNTVDAAVTALNKKAGLYVLISSDSVYMVSRRDQHLPVDSDSDEYQINQQRPWKEEDAVRPYSATLQERLQEADPYGHDKFECEEAVIKQRQEGGIPYVMLRLPDILGGRDTTNRWWPYQIWLQYYKDIGIPFRFPEKTWNTKTSYAYVHDVVDIVSTVLRLNSSTIWDQAFNIAFEEPLSVPDLLQKTQSVLGIDDVKYEKLDDGIDDQDQAGIPGVLALLPSVDVSIDISKVKTVIGWKPTPIEKALHNITSFYKWAFGKFPLQRKKAIGTLFDHFFPNQNDPEIQSNLITFRTKLDAEIQAAGSNE